MKSAPVKLTKKDFASDQDVRWCPGCGDYAILATVQKVLADVGIPREDTVFVSGIGCSSRFPYYMNTYGFHSIHGRAPAIATGLKVARPDLSVWVITGDGDGLSIGGNHLLHAIRRNVDLNIILFNNQIYGLTKGQYSPTSMIGTKAPSTPVGSLDYPVQPLQVALGAGATFAARCIDVDAAGLGEVLARAHAHKGASFVEVLQNCPVFNDGVWDPITDKPVAESRQLRIKHGEPLLFDGGKRGIRIRTDLTAEVVMVGDGDGQVPLAEIARHDEKGSPAYSFLLAQLLYPEMPVPLGVLRAVDKTPYDTLVAQQNAEVTAKRGPGDLRKLLHSGMTWQVK
ncbi:MAG TPA: 2-oxoacid:ferredoxin oxidoreductase subunit beta [Kofleriaceae bacterium]|nr:2-oxoacid:ferredoxin oxidoreductase subunit beta [Kofleriaceae bacterium]